MSRVFLDSLSRTQGLISGYLFNSVLEDPDYDYDTSGVYETDGFPLLESPISRSKTVKMSSLLSISIGRSFATVSFVPGGLVMHTTLEHSTLTSNNSFNFIRVAQLPDVATRREFDEALTDLFTFFTTDLHHTADTEVLTILHFPFNV